MLRNGDTMHFPDVRVQASNLAAINRNRFARRASRRINHGVQREAAGAEESEITHGVGARRGRLRIEDRRVQVGIWQGLSEHRLAQGTGAVLPCVNRRTDRL